MTKIYNLNNLLKLSEKEYNNEMVGLEAQLLEDYKSIIREFTYKPITEDLISPFLKDQIVKILIEGEEYELTNGNLLSLLYVYRIININYNRDNSDIPNIEDLLFDPSNVREFNNALDEIYMLYIDQEDIKDLIFDTLSMLSNLAGRFTAGTINLYDIYMLKKNNPEFAVLLDYSINENDSYSNIINNIKNNMNKIEDFLTNTDSCYRPLIKSGSGMNMKQASQMFNVIGPKPDMFGNIHDHMLNTNFLNGLRNKRDFLVNSDNARKALAANATSVKDSGYLTRILLMLCVDTKLSDIEKCETPHTNYPKVYIKDNDILKKYKHRNMWDEETNKLRIVGSDTSLIGTYIRVASPITCSCEDGICKTCYGQLYKSISIKVLSNGKKLRENIGLIAVLLLTEKLTQTLLSTKHLLEASTDKIDWGKLSDYLDISGNKMSIKEEYSFKDIQLVDFTDEGNITKLKIKDSIIELPESLELNDESYYINYTTDNPNIDILEEKIKDDEEEVDGGKDYVFRYIAKNNELSKPVYEISSLLNTSEITNRDINDNLNHFLDLLDKANFNISSEHVEVILRELVLTADRSRYTFTTNEPKYELVRATKKVLEDNVVKSLLFERLEEQLLKLSTYVKNNKDSLLDFLL